MMCHLSSMSLKSERTEQQDAETLTKIASIEAEVMCLFPLALSRLPRGQFLCVSLLAFLRISLDSHKKSSEKLSKLSHVCSFR